MKSFKFLQYLILCVFILSISAFPQSVGSELNLMPIPKTAKLESGKFQITKDFKVAVVGVDNSRAYDAATRMLRHLSGRTGLFFTQDFITQKTSADSAQMVITFKTSPILSIKENEDYTLDIKSNNIALDAKTDLGVLHGLQTLLQLLQNDENGYFFPNVKIVDSPRFKWRGLMIDVARHFMPVGVIKRNLNAMEAMKMNVLHLHLSDNQGFRVESKVFPKLTELGSDGKYFTQNQIKDIIKYADERGIRVIPEFDVPGHSTSWLVGYPQFASAPGPYKITREWGVFDDVMNPTIDATYKFLDKLFGEMASLFPDDYFHIGGDENNGKDWNANKEIQAFMKKNHIPDNHALQTYFNKKILKILAKHGKKMVGWDEILQPDMPNNIVIQSWRGQKALFDAARKGYMGILSNGYYIDLNQHADYHYLNDPIPPDSVLSDEARKNILGGEATMWSEMVTPENVDSRIWPRTAAIAERFWSPQNIRNVDDMYRRLRIINRYLEDYGTTQIKNYSMMLRRLANGYNISVLKNFVDIIEPVKKYARHRQGVKYYSYSPYTRAVDAARPESEIARIFNKLVENFQKDENSDDALVIKTQLSTWEDNKNNLMPVINHSPILKEIVPMVDNLHNISVIALQAIKYIQSNQKPDSEWIRNANAALEEAKKPYGQTELAILPGIQELITTAFNK